MSANSKQVKIGDVLVSLKTGLNPRSNFKLNTPSAKNWYITVRELNGIGVDFLPQTDRVDDQALKRINTRSNLEVGDVLFSGTGTIGKTAIVSQEPKNWNIKEGVYVLKPNKKLVEPYFLLYQLRYYADMGVFDKQTGGSTVFSVPMKLLSDTPFHLPPLDTQKNISSIIKNIDDKIELNNKINAELEQMAKTLYDYWFVQFDFPDANGNPYKSSGGAMLYNEDLKREIPKVWRVEKISDACRVIDCLHSKKPEYQFEANNYYLLQLENLRDDGLLDTSKKYYVSKSDYVQWTSRIEVRDGDILLTNAGRVAGFAQVPQGILTGIGRNITAVRPEKINSTYLGYYFKGADIWRQVKVSTDTGSFFSSLNVHAIKKLHLLRAAGDIETKFVEIAEPLRRKRELTLVENQKLAELRDWLLPMLMNGQVTVK